MHISPVTIVWNRRGDHRVLLYKMVLRHCSSHTTRITSLIMNLHAYSLRSFPFLHLVVCDYDVFLCCINPVDVFGKYREGIRRVKEVLLLFLEVNVLLMVLVLK